MNTKSFAQQSRTNLMQGVESKLHYWGFSEKGKVTETPVKIEGGYTFRGDVFDDNTTPSLWQSMKMAIDKKGFDAVKEEAAYTWFNRMMAIQILAKNGYEQPQLAYAEGMQHTPMILQRARQGFYDFLNPEEQRRLKLILPDYSQDQVAFTILLIGYCHSHILLSNVFGGIDDYTELLLPDNMLSDNGFLHLMNTTDAITDEQYREVELIGWLYQFYISEKKDEVFAGFKKNKKAEAKDIPAATQIFTPNWIVKYMVQNTVGKLWLDLHPESPLKKEMKYLVESENAEYGKSIIKEVKELKLLDPASGSGHILVEGFDLLFKMYKEEYYSDEEAVESILINNLFGLDIDKRAVQLAQFAVLLKAAKVFPAVLKKGWLLQIFAMPEPYGFSRQEVLDFLGSEGAVYDKQLSSILALMQQAQNLGSIMRFALPDQSRTFIVKRLQELQHKPSLSFYEQAVLPRIRPFINVYDILSAQFEAVAANPPYMGQKNMNGSLKNYVNGNYNISRSDLFAVFMEVCSNLIVRGGLYGMINQQSWMFLSSYDELRNGLLNNQHLKSMLHLGPRTFDELSGEVVQNTAFVIENSAFENSAGCYYRLIEYRSSEIKHQNFLLRNNQYSNIQQSNFSKIPGRPIAYWASNTILNIFLNCNSLQTVSPARIGMMTSDNERFLREWNEVALPKIGFGFHERSSAEKSNYKWFPYNKGGGFKKWYGNNYLIVNWQNGGLSIIKNGMTSFRGKEFYFKEGITWSFINSSNFGVRYKTNGYLFDIQGSSSFPNIQDFYYIIGFLNSVVTYKFLSIINPTLSFQGGNINNLPFIKKEGMFKIDELVLANISISKYDWNSHESSWDFQQHPLLFHRTNTVKQSFQTWLQQVNYDFFQLLHNEEELNRIFIEIYGLQDELSPEVPLKDITILQDELDYNALEQLRPPYDGQLVPVKKEVVMQQLISYAIGCFMGRYRLDAPGLHIAHPNPRKEEIVGYTYNGHSFEIDDDAIIPLMGSACDFPDDAVNRFKNFLDIVWGANKRIENLNFLQECLDQDVEKFMVKDFWKVHCKMYNKKPIYWLFSSPKGAFQVLVYMHRMNAFTVEKIRSKYLIDHLKSLRSKISLMEKSESLLNAQDSRVLDKLRKDLQECEQYDMTLKPFADKQITFDLDNGVTENYKLFKGVVAEIK
jgi:hypothetical protein